MHIIITLFLLTLLMGTLLLVNTSTILTIQTCRTTVSALLPSQPQHQWHPQHPLPQLPLHLPKQLFQHVQYLAPKISGSSTYPPSPHLSIGITVSQETQFHYSTQEHLRESYIAAVELACTKPLQGDRQSQGRNQLVTKEKLPPPNPTSHGRK